jgi:ribonuclease HII
MVVGGVSGLYQETFKDLGVKDSKLLSETKRNLLGTEIRRVARRVELLPISADEIDRRRRDETMNTIEVSMFAIVARRLRADELFLDAADVDAARFGRRVGSHLAATTSVPRIVSEHKADLHHPIVSAASIVAKVRRDFEVARLALPLEKKLGLPMGSGYPHDPLTIRFLETWVKRFGSLPPHTRRSWDTARMIEARALTKSLDEFVVPAAVVPMPGSPRSPLPARR